jgi:hypothetical protein
MTLMRYHKRCWLIQTAGRWPWKSESAKECVTTHLPNQLALKMDGARASDLYRTVVAIKLYTDHASTSRQVAVVSLEALGVSLGGAAAGADLGGSSKYSNENFED